MYKSNEQRQWEDDCREQRLNEQKQSNDYSYSHDGEREFCEDCGASLNSHGHCPNCDY